MPTVAETLSFFEACIFVNISPTDHLYFDQTRIQSPHQFNFKLKIKDEEEYMAYKNTYTPHTKTYCMKFFWKLY